MNEVDSNNNRSCEQRFQGAKHLLDEPLVQMCLSNHRNIELIGIYDFITLRVCVLITDSGAIL